MSSKILALIIAIFVIFIWIFSIPLLILTSIIWIPAGVGAAIVSTVVSGYIQWTMEDDIVIDGIFRKLVALLPLKEWFTPFSVKGKADEDTPLLILGHPHGILCCGLVIYHFSRKNTVFAVAPILFYIPIFGWVARSMGLIPASFKMIKKALTEKHSVIMAVGGIEGLISHPHQTLYITKRYGYLKIAMDTKTPLKPVYIQGEFDTFYSPRLPFLKERRVLARLGIPVLFPYVFGFCGTWLPKRVPLTLHFGERLEVGNLELMELKRRYHDELRHLLEELTLPPAIMSSLQ